MKLHDAIVKFAPKEWEGNYGPYLGCKVELLDSGEEVNMYESDTENAAFLSLKKGQKIQILEDVNRAGKPKYKPVLDSPPIAPSTSTSTRTFQVTPRQRLDQLLDCFAEILTEVEHRWPNREPDDQREIATTMLIQLQKEFVGTSWVIIPQCEDPDIDQARAIANEPDAIGVDTPDPGKPWASWRTPDDAIVWAMGILPDWDVHDLQQALRELPGEKGKKAKVWAEWVWRRKEIFSQPCEDDIHY